MNTGRCPAASGAPSSDGSGLIDVRIVNVNQKLERNLTSLINLFPLDRNGYQHWNNCSTYFDRFIRNHSKFVEFSLTLKAKKPNASHPQLSHRNHFVKPTSSSAVRRADIHAESGSRRSQMRRRPPWVRVINLHRQNPDFPLDP